MTTERMEAYALEEQDLIFVNGQVYRVIAITPTDEGYRFQLADEEGNLASMVIEDTTKVPVVIDNYTTV